MNKINRIKELTELLNQYRDRYYNSNDSAISDYEYDALFDELKQLEQDTGIVMSNSPTHTVGFEVKSKLQKVKHSHPMLSLDKTKSVEDLKNFANGHDCILMLKLDGLSCLINMTPETNLTTQNNFTKAVLQRAATRGNALVGEDITHNAKVFLNIPLSVNYADALEVEGEAVIMADDFEAINDKLPEDNKYKNSRNLVSGSVRQLDSRIAAERRIKFIAWKVPTAIAGLDTMSERLEYVKSLGFDIVPYKLIRGDDVDYDKYIEELKKEAQEGGYPIDGLVLAYNDIAYGESLGATEHHPKHSIAFKFYDEEALTNVQGVEWTMGKSGILTPTLIFDAVEIDGTVISRASLHNVSIVKNLKLGIGDTITVYKANQIIPQVRENLSKSNTYQIPDVCPICGGKTSISKRYDSEILCCTNYDCPGELLGKLTHFVSRDAINIEGLSDKTIQRFITLGFIQSFIDIFYLKDYKDELCQMDGFGEKSVNNLLESIEKSRNTTLDRFLYALCIPYLGRSICKEISAMHNGDFHEFKAALLNEMSAMEQGENTNSMLNIKGLGQHTLNSLIDSWSNYGKFVYTELAKEFVFQKEEASVIENNNIAGKTFVITGSLNHYKNRDELVAVIEQNGGKASGSVSKKTDYLINNDIESTSGKNAKAKQLGVPIIDEEQFMQMLR